MTNCVVVASGIESAVSVAKSTPSAGVMLIPIKARVDSRGAKPWVIEAARTARATVLIFMVVDSQ